MLAAGAAGGTRLRCAMAQVLSGDPRRGPRAAGGGRPAAPPPRRRGRPPRAGLERGVGRGARGRGPRGARWAGEAPLLRRCQPLCATGAGADPRRSGSPRPADALTGIHAQVAALGISRGWRASAVGRPASRTRSRSEALDADTVALGHLGESLGLRAVSPALQGSFRTVVPMHTGDAPRGGLDVARDLLDERVLARERPLVAEPLPELERAAARRRDRPRSRAGTPRSAARCRRSAG